MCDRISYYYCLQLLPDELIRQITINCAERGLLLLRVRDEARMTITAYETLYESSIAYGVRKALVAEQKRIDLDAKLRELAMAKRELQQQVESLKNTIEATQARSVQKRDAEEKAHSDDVSQVAAARVLKCSGAISFRSEPIVQILGFPTTC